MAEMTKDMYGAIGKFGNRMYCKRGGKTIARVIPKPKIKTGIGNKNRRFPFLSSFFCRKIWNFQIIFLFLHHRLFANIQMPINKELIKVE